ncbi:hypothetical protein FGIG_11039 [Fasciola gigantica]|uniref:Uncharacterized protein n=1 Tax=Fasciola gigantica TaxID=46835 RepID=A0A504YNE9_FASGI|nr:hypothetical protein FGIG_11039 [Fasciola gigantica]
MRTELATLRLSVWPQLQRLCDSRGFSLQVIDRSVETDFNPPVDPDQEMEQIFSELTSYLEQRTHENKFLNCLILLSNQNVGWLPTLPTHLPSDDVERIIKEAKKEVERMQDDIATQMANMPGSKSGQSMASKAVSDRESSSSILPDIVRFDEPQRRQNALDCWLKEAHIIRALLWRYWDSNTAGSRKNRPKSEQPSPVRNSTGSKWDVNDKSSETIDTGFLFAILIFLLHEVSDFSRFTFGGTYDDNVTLSMPYKITLEAHVQTILDQEAQNADCFVVIRSQEEDSESTSRHRKKSGSGNAYPRPISPATISTTRTREDTLHTVRSSRYHGLNEVNQFLQLPMEASRMRAKLLMEYARLRVPQFNQIHYDLSGQTNTDVEEEILGRHNLVDPLSRADHAGYLEELVRNMHQVFEKSLQQEMDRRLTIEAELHSLSDCDSAANEVRQPLLWDLPYEIQAHQEACEEL